MSSLTSITPSSFHILTSEKSRKLPKQRFSGIPWDASLAQNQVLNRLFVDTFGYHGPWAAFARNKYERIEIGYDWLCWVAVGVGMPVVLGALFNKGYAGKFLKKFKLKPKPLGITFEESNILTLKNPEARKALAQKLGVIKDSDLGTVQSIIRKGKVLLLATDLFCMAVKGQVSWWSKNWVTEKLSGKKGFVGEFKFTSDAFREKKSEQHEKDKYKKMLISLALGMTGVASLPLLIYAGLKNPKMAANKGMQKFISYFNYEKVVYLSKYLIVWHDIFNYLAPSVLSSRDSHELREKMTKGICSSFFMLLGDDLIGGAYANYLQNTSKYAKALKGHKIVEKGLWGTRLPVAVPYEKLATKIAEKMEKKLSVSDAERLAVKLSRRVFWVGLTGTCLCLGVALNLFNRIYTQKKVTEEQNKFSLSTHSRIKGNQQPIYPLRSLPVPSIQPYLQQTRPNIYNIQPPSWLSYLPPQPQYQA